MSSDNVKIRKISLLNFRGAKDLLELDLSSECKSCAIFGNNAEGKSTFTQAIEWFYTDRIAYLRGEGITDEDIINLASSREEETFVGLVYNNPDLNSSKIYDKKNKRHKFSNNTDKFRSYIENEAKYDRLYLDQHTILWFLARTKGEKKEEIAKIVGYEDIVKVKSTISSALHDLERNPRLAELKRNLSYNQGLMTKEIYGESVNNIPALLIKSKTFLNVFGIKEEINNLAELDKSIEKAFQLLPSQERAKERVELETLRSKIKALDDKRNLFNSIIAWISSFNKLVEDRENVQNLNLDEFLRQAEKVLVQKPDADTCPLCLQPIKSQEILLKSIVERYQKLDRIRQELKGQMREFSNLKAKIQEVIDDCSHILEELSKRNIIHDSVKIKGYSVFFESNLSQIDQQVNNLKPVSIDNTELDRVIKDLGLVLSEINEELKNRISSLSITKEEEQRQTAYQKMVRGKELVLTNISYEKEIFAFMLLIQNMHNIEDQMLELQNSTMRYILDLLSDDVNKYFCDLNKRDKIKNVKLETKGEEGIEFSLEFYDREASPPRKFLSESQLNSLGIAFFLAAVKKFNKSNRFFVLDDVLVSFDRNYRLRLLELLEDNFSDYQIILLTHEEYWYEMIKKKFSNWVFKEVIWDFNTGIRFKDTKVDQLENIHYKFTKGDKVGNELRTYVESLLKDICIPLEVKMAFRLGLDNERRMIGEIFSALTSTLNNHRSDLPKCAAYKDLEVSNFIVTCASHHNPDLDSMGDIEETIEKIKKFRALFICPNGRMVERRNLVPGQDKISCKCGCLQISWRT
jgi:recombinational DNA repair ATPase RecF